MAEDRPEELKGWPVSWYVGGDFQKGYLKCPAANCEDVFKNAKEVENRTEHQFLSLDYASRFQHCILAAMCYVTRCPKCVDFVRTTRNMGPNKPDSDIRALLQHEYDVHGTEDLRDVQKFVGFVRQFRYKKFGAKNITDAIHLWKEVDTYHRTTIKQQPRYEDLKAYLKNDCKISMKGDWLGRINKTCRDTEFPKEAKGPQLAQCQDYFPVDPNAFLKQFEPESREPGVVHVWDVMRAQYFSGYI